MRFLTFSWADFGLRGVASSGCVEVGSKFGVVWRSEVSGYVDVVGVAQELLARVQPVCLGVC